VFCQLRGKGRLSNYSAIDIAIGERAKISAAVTILFKHFPSIEL
jgi:hypothetical protein